MAENSDQLPIQEDILVQVFNLIRDFNIYDTIGIGATPPASAIVVQNLPEVVVEEKDKECTICLKELKIGIKYTKLPCNHTYHKECIVSWLNKRNSCPLCREELPTDDEAYEEYKKSKIQAKEREEMLNDLHNSMFT